MYKRYNKGNLVVSERFIRTLKSKIYKHMTAMWKNGYIDKLDIIVGKCNITYHKITKMKSADLEPCMHVDNGIQRNHKDFKLKIRDRVRIWIYKNIFVRGYTRNWSEEVFMIKKVKNTIPRKFVISDRNFMKKSSSRQAKKNSGLKK